MSERIVPTVIASAGIPWDPEEADDAQYERELIEDLEPPRKDRWYVPYRAPYRVVRCTETDDFTSPRGELWPSNASYVFGPWVYPGDVQIGLSYVVDADGRVVAELL